jgi:hypothetical protein
MEDHIGKIFSDAKKIALTADEKASGREMFRAYMAMRPIRDVSPDAAVRQGMARKPFGFALLTSLVKPMSVFALVLALMVSAGGVSYAAEGALPGDALYPVKVSINEEVRAVAAVSAEEKAEWETERAERRLAEAEALAAKGMLKAKAAAEVEKRFVAHAASAKAHIIEAEATADAGAAAELDAGFEGALNAHKKILSLLASAEAKGGNDDDGDEDEDGETSLAAAVEAETKAVVQRREKSQQKVAVKASADIRTAAEARKAASRRTVDEVRALFAKMRVRMDAEAVASADARIAAAEKSLADGDAKLASGEYAAAFSLYLEAHRNAQEAKRFIKAGTSFRFRADDRRADEPKSDEKGDERREDDRRGDDGRSDDGRREGAKDGILKLDGDVRLRL